MGCLHSKQTPTSSRTRDVSFSKEDVLEAFAASRSGSEALQMLVASASQRGWDPRSPKKENQDSLLIRPKFLDQPNLHVFGVFDGHGLQGAACASLIQDQVEQALKRELEALGLNDLATVPEATMNKVLHAVYDHAEQELSTSVIDDSFCGATVLLALVVGHRVFIANCGESRAVWAQLHYPKNNVTQISTDHNPYNVVEAKRVREAGGFIMTTAQRSSVLKGEQEATAVKPSPIDQTSDPLRIYDRGLQHPSCTFTRSIGDSYAKQLGVTAAPECIVQQLSIEEGGADDCLLLLASDGAFQFYTNEDLVNMLSTQKDHPVAACQLLLDAVWKRSEDKQLVADDTSAIVIFVGRRKEALVGEATVATRDGTAAVV